MAADVIGRLGEAMKWPVGMLEPLAKSLRDHPSTSRAGKIAAACVYEVCRDHNDNPEMIIDPWLFLHAASNLYMEYTASDGIEDIETACTGIVYNALRAHMELESMAREGEA